MMDFNFTKHLQAMTAAERERVVDLTTEILQVLQRHCRKVTKNQVRAVLGVTALFIGEIEDWPEALVSKGPRRQV